MKKKILKKLTLLSVLFITVQSYARDVQIKNETEFEVKVLFDYKSGGIFGCNDPTPPENLTLWEHKELSPNGQGMKAVAGCQIQNIRVLMAKTSDGRWLVDTGWIEVGGEPIANFFTNIAAGDQDLEIPTSVALKVPTSVKIPKSGAYLGEITITQVKYLGKKERQKAAVKQKQEEIKKLKKALEEED